MFARRIGERGSRVAIAAAILALLLLAKALPAWEALSGSAFDILSTAGQPVPEEPVAVIVAIDEPSFSAIGQPWPWPRDLHARLIRSLRAAGAEAIVFDIVFAEPSDPAADAALAEAADARTVFAADETLLETPHATSLVRTEPFPELLADGARAGVTAVSLDGDGVARRISRYPDSLPRRMLEAAGRRAAETDPGAERLIQYFGPSGSYPRLSYYQALEPRKYLPPDFLRGRNVIIGYAVQATADVGAGTDMFETAYTRINGQLTPGVEIQATVADNLLHGLSVRPAADWIALLLLIMGGALGYVVAAPAGLVRRLTIALAAAFCLVVLSWIALRFGRLWVSPGEPVIALAAVFAGLGVRDFAVERRRRREIQGAFSQYVSPAMVERLAANPELLKLGGERKVMTILFADIRGFTTISEAMKGDPEGLTRVVNDILTPLSDIVIAHGGTIDKYMGDCVMAFWNAPLDDPDHAANGVRAGIAMVEALPAINQAVQARLPERHGEKPTVRIGVGVNSGECVVGNMGSAQRFDYSVLGDAVNVASRIEGLSKDYGVPMIVGEAAVALAGDAFDFVELDRIAVRGKSEPLAIHAVKGLA
ncbi:CHASE2 domain-containing protein [Enterovirga sp. GCM10030262]|uniref:CHASE2 domain-containing protein n=1 Tax=Enterovirga sp. GCM10030262 TaxID=3273391 RepID=UPI00361F595F